MTDDRLPAPSLSEELAWRASHRDAGFLLAVPVVLVLLWAAGEPVQAALAFNSESPTVVTALGAHYVHATAGHLVGNIAVYLGAVGVGYPLAVLGGCRRLFVRLTGGLLLVTPFVLSGFYLAFLGPGVILGFSGLALALVGLLPMVLLAYLRSRVVATVSVADAPGVFLLGAAALTWQAPGPLPAVGPLAVAAVGLLALAPLGWRFGLARQAGVRPPPSWAYTALPIVVLLVFITTAVMATPAWVAAGSGGSSLLLHLLGYGTGFVGAYGAAGWRRLRSPPRPPAVAG